MAAKIWPVANRLFLLLLAAAAPSSARAADDADAFFRQQIAPIFELRCLNCHQGEKPKGNLSLTSLAGMVAGGESGPAIVPGHADQSLLVEYVSGEKPEMPKGGAALAAAEVEKLRRWIDDGARWPDGLLLKNAQRADESWWAFQPVVRPNPPTINDPAASDPAWAQNPIDAFVLAGLVEKGLRPSPPADRLTLLRRAYFDLIGLPPPPDEIAAFLADDAPDAFARVVDRLLASPHYGERWGRHWLDVVHYADTEGFESDGRRANAWRYRDYVIDAFNADKPFDRFLREQIAGDTIVPADPAAVAALGFLGTGPWDKIGHETRAADLRHRARSDELDDIVTTVAATALGLTINCARCHDHKFDPLPQRDYYRLVAVFAGVKHGERIVRPSDQKRAAELRAELAQIKLERGRLERAPLNLADFVAGGNGFGSGNPAAGLDPRSGQASSGKLGILPGLEIGRFVPSKLPFIDGTVVPNGPATVTSTGIVIDTPTTDGQSWDYIQSGPVLSQDKSEIAGVDYSQPGHAMIALHANKALTFDLEAIRREYPEFREARFQAVAAYGGLGAGSSADFAVYVDGKLRAGRKNINYAAGPTPVDFALAADERFLTLVATDGGNGIAFDQIFFGDPRLVADPAGQPDANTDPAVRTALLDRERSLAEQLVASAAEEKVYAVVSQDPPPVHLLTRGDPESPADEVTPGGLSVIHTLPGEFGDSTTPEANRRAALAAWLTDRANPLVSRVAVNRVWHYHFGTGLVATPSDFGFNGDRPSHPALLDWLASELLDHAGSLKHLHRLILLSRTYQQSSRAGAESQGAAIDGQNRLLWRMSRRRLEGEAVRDAILTVSGKLNRQAGGPGYQDFSYIEKYAPVYQYVVADRPELWRRSVYRFTVRSVPNPWLETLDCPNPSILTPNRTRTTTALQALSLLNNPFVLQQSGYFAQRVTADAGKDPAAEIRLAYLLCFGREPTVDEAAEAGQFVDRQGLTAFCHLLFNASEFIYVD